MTNVFARAAALSAAAILLAGPAMVGAAPTQSTRAAAPRAQSPMTFAALERRAIAMGIRPTELKIGMRTAEIEGRDAQGRKVEVKLDPHSGAVLRRAFDD